MTNTFREHRQRAIFETFDQSDNKTWPDQQKDGENKDKDHDDDKYI